MSDKIFIKLKWMEFSNIGFSVLCKLNCKLPNLFTHKALRSSSVNSLNMSLLSGSNWNFDKKHFTSKTIPRRAPT